MRLVFIVALLFCGANAFVSVPFLHHTFVLCDPATEADRYAYMKEHLRSFGPAVSFVSYPPWNAVTPSLRARYHFAESTPSLSSGEQAVLINHILIAEHIRGAYAGGLFLVLESDALFVPNITTHLRALTTEWLVNKLDIDAVFLGNCLGLVVPASDVVPGQYLYQTGKTRCSDSMIWSYTGIDYFLKFFEAERDIVKPIDHLYNDYIARTNRGGHIYWSYPSLVTQGTKNSVYASRLG